MRGVFNPVAESKLIMSKKKTTRVKEHTPIINLAEAKAWAAQR